MEATKKLRGPAGVRMWMGLALLAAVTTAVMVLGRAIPATRTSVLTAATVGAAGVLAMAVLLAPIVRYPRWAHWSSALVLAAWILAGAVLSESPSYWVDQRREHVWLMPWFVFTMAYGGTARGICSAQGRLGGWTLVGASVIFPSIFVVAEWLGRRF